MKRKKNEESDYFHMRGAISERNKSWIARHRFMDSTNWSLRSSALLSCDSQIETGVTCVVETVAGLVSPGFTVVLACLSVAEDWCAGS